MKYNISHIYLHNFQSIEGPVRIDFSPITFLYGPNSSGKSAIYDAIKIALNLCAGDGYDDTKKLIAKFMHMHNFKNKMIIGIGSLVEFSRFYKPPALSTYDLLDILPSLEYLFRRDEFSFKELIWDIRFTLITTEYHDASVDLLEIYESNQLVVKLYIDKGDLVINLLHPLVVSINKAITKDGFSLQDLCQNLIRDNSLKFENGYIYIYGIGFDKESSWVPGEIIWESDNYPYDNSAITSPHIQKLEIVLQYLIFSPLRDVAYIGKKLSRVGPLRIIPKHEDLQFFLTDQSYGEYHKWYATTIHNRTTSDDDGYNAWLELASNNEIYYYSSGGSKDKYEKHPILTIVNEWLLAQDRLNLGCSIEITTRDIANPIYFTNDSTPHWPASTTQAEGADKICFMKIFNNKLNLSVAVQDVGVGIAQLIPILVLGLTKNQTFIEQPELHLHPKLQMQIADYFAATWNSTYNRFIIETHSEYIALRLLRRIRETSRNIVEKQEYLLKPEDVSFYYFDSINGVTEVKKLRTTPAGEFLDRWPKGFFAEREGELFDDIN